MTHPSSFGRINRVPEKNKRAPYGQIVPTELPRMYQMPHTLQYGIRGMHIFPRGMNKLYPISVSSCQAAWQKWVTLETHHWNIPEEISTKPIRLQFWAVHIKFLAVLSRQNLGSQGRSETLTLPKGKRRSILNSINSPIIFRERNL